MGASIWSPGSDVSPPNGTWINAKEFPYLAAGTGGATDDTAALQAAITAAESAATTRYGFPGIAAAQLYIPGGVYNVRGLRITRPINIIGDGKQTTIINLLEGSTAPAFKVQCSTDGINYFAFGRPCWVGIKHLTITAANSGDTAGLNLAHGVYFTDASTNPVFTWLELEDISVVGMPATNIFGENVANGIAILRDVQSYYAGQDIFRVFSCADFRLNGCDFGGGQGPNAEHVLNFSGASALEITDSFFYTAKKNVVNLFGAITADFKGCYFDLAGQSAVAANLTLVGSYPSEVTFSQCYFRWASQSADNSFGTFSVTTGTGGVIKLFGCSFRSLNNPFGANKSNGDITFDAAGVGVNTRFYIDAGTTFDRGFIAGVSGDGRAITNRVDYLTGFTSKLAAGANNSILPVSLWADRNYTTNAPLTGTTQVIAAGKTSYLATPAGTLAALNINLPPPYADGQEFRISSTQAITSLVIGAQAPATSVFNAPTTLAAGGTIGFKYIEGGTAWVRI